MAAGNVQASQLLYLRTPSSGRIRYIASVLTKPNRTRRCFGTTFEQGKQFVKDAAVEITSLTPSNIRYCPLLSSDWSSVPIARCSNRQQHHDAREGGS
jgi:hypothetical protein